MPQSLCETCLYMRGIHTARSRFLLCELSLTDFDYPKYPRQPIVRCDGYELRDITIEHPEGDSLGINS
jgi:hypothetical protein